MTDHADPRAYFDALWADGDPWNLDTSAYDQQKYSRELALLTDRRIARALEIGCGAGAFTRRLAAVADRVLALDVSPRAIARAQAEGRSDRIEYRVADIVGFDAVAEGPWDAIVLSETIYYVGWRHSFFDVGWAAHCLVESMRAGGRLLMTNTIGLPGHHLQMKSLIETYRDMFLNAGLQLSRTESYAADKGGSQMEALICLFEKGPAPIPVSPSPGQSGS